MKVELNELATARQAAFQLSIAAGEFVVRVRGRCMEPRLREGMRVRIKACAAAALAPGDVIMCRRGDEWFLHRFLGTLITPDDPRLLTKADCKRRPDPLWREDELAGKLVAVAGGNEFVAYTPSRRERLTACLWRTFFCLRYRCGLGRAKPDVTITSLWLPLPDGPWRLDLPGETELVAAIKAEFGDCLPDKNAPVGEIEVRPEPEPPVGDEANGFSGDCIRLRSDKLQLACDFTRRSARITMTDRRLLPAGLRSLVRLLAMRKALVEDGVALHASSVRHGRGCVVFVGPSGAGKTTAAQAFPAPARLDDDFVLLLPQADGFCRVAWRPGIDHTPPVPVTAICLPRRGEDFRQEQLPVGEALAACLHLPPLLRNAGNGGPWLQAVARLCETVPVYAVTWRKGEDLPALLVAAGIG